MTYQEFLTQLRKTPRRWVVQPRWSEDDYGYGNIRTRERQSACPILAVAKMRGAHYEIAAEKLGLDRRVMGRIVDAADGVLDTAHDKRIRKDLLRACGLEEAKREG